MRNYILGAYLELIYSGKWRTSKPEWRDLSDEDSSDEVRKQKKKWPARLLEFWEGIRALPRLPQAIFALLLISIIPTMYGVVTNQAKWVMVGYVMEVVLLGATYKVTEKHIGEQGLERYEQCIKRQIVPLRFLLQDVDCYSERKIQWLIGGLQGTTHSDGYAAEIVKLAIIPVGAYLMELIAPKSSAIASLVVMAVAILLMIVVMCVMYYTKFSRKAMAKREFVESLEYLLACDFTSG